MNRAEIKIGISAVREQILKAAAAAGRDPDTIRIVAVAKTVTPEKIQAAIDEGVSIIGDNYIQEARERENLPFQPSVSRHFIGHLQTNKAKFAVRMFDLIHSVDSLKLAQELDRQAAIHLKTQEILIQVNLAEERTKSGVKAEETLPLVREVVRLDHIRVRGLMTMPPFFDLPEKARPYFSALRELSRNIAAENIPGVHMTELSMGMSGDFVAAVEEGATLVRIGTALFGTRS